MAKNNRDDFKPKTKNNLALRAGHRCSICRCGTSGPSDDSIDSTVSIGAAAHIYAAAPGGPRYNADMTPEQRESIENGIWLCRNHETHIDRDKTTYTPETLFQIKTSHELWIKSMMGIPSAMEFKSDLFGIGPDVVFTGAVSSFGGSEWRIRIDHFVIGDRSDLVKFIDSYHTRDRYDRFVLAADIGDGREFSDAPTLQVSGSNFEIACPVMQTAERIDPRNLKKDFDFDMGLNESGDIKMVSGLDALPQRIRSCLSIIRGEMLFQPDFGSRIGELFNDLHDSPWLARFVKLEVIRMASIPHVDQILQVTQTPLQCVRLVKDIQLGDKDGIKLPVALYLDLEGFGAWEGNIEIFVPDIATMQDQRAKVAAIRNQLMGLR